MLFYLLDNSGHFIRQRTAVGITKHDAIDTGLLGSFECFDGILRIGLVAIEKMLGIINNFRNVFLQICQRVLDQLEILFQADTQRLAHMEIPGFTEDRHRVGRGLDQGLDIIVFVRCSLGPSGGTESGYLGMVQGDLLHIFEKSDVLRIGPGPTALDIVDTEFIKFFGYPNLVCDQK